MVELGIRTYTRATSTRSCCLLQTRFASSLRPFASSVDDSTRSLCVLFYLFIGYVIVTSIRIIYISSRMLSVWTWVLLGVVTSLSSVYLFVSHFARRRFVPALLLLLSFL